MNFLDHTLETFSRIEPAAELVQDAQRKLEALIARTVPRPRKPRVAGWLAAAASALVAVIAVIWLPFAPTTALAFSQVQAHFRDFHTLRFEIEQRVNGNTLMKSRVSVLANGSVRTEVGDDVIVIVNTQEMRVMSLVKRGRVAVVTPLDKAGTPEDAMKWLDDVRDFQGQARELPDTRWIQGHRAHGWELPVEQGRITLWADEAGLPLEMKLDQGVAMEMSFHFEFEPTLPANYFSTEVPAGYTLGTEEN